MKREVRRRCSDARAALATEARDAAASSVAAFGIGFASPRAGCSVSAYAAMGAELDPAGLIARLDREHFVTCLPVTPPLGNPLVFRTWRPGEPLVERRWGIREPADDAPAIDPDLLLVPLLAFDRQGRRLGYGGGYYDRTLARLRRLKPVIAIGLAFASQEVPEVPASPHDEPLDWVLTENGPIAASPA